MESEPTYPSSSQVTLPQPPILFSPVYAAGGYAAGMAYGAIPPLMRGEGWKGAARTNALRSGPRTAAWLGLSCVIGNTLSYLRKKEDDWNGIIGFGLGAGLSHKHLGIKRGTLVTILAGSGFCLGNMVIHKMGWYAEIKQDDYNTYNQHVLGLAAEKLKKIF